jgi:iron complex outermembrane receptor protein
MFKRKVLPVLISGLLGSGLAGAADTSNVGRIDVQGEAGYGGGLIVPEESSKARSQVNKSAIEKALPTASPYQLIDMLPGINTSSQDATGLFGGSLTMRGFNSDQIGFTIDGAPVNDSGNFAVYPQEYVDSENLEEIFVTQGSTDTDAPHVGATGGNIGIVSNNPTDYFRVKAAQTFGELNMFKSFIRLDTGKFANDTTKAYISYSKSKADKWRGEGNADRDHIDAKIVTKIAPGSQVSMGVLYNDAVNNFFKRVTLKDYQTRDYFYDYATTFPGRLTPVAGTVQNESTAVAGVSRADYYALQVNPFKNALVTAKGNFQLNDQWRLDVEPYYWYGYGNGSFGTTLREGGTGVTGVRDLNGDGDTIDTVLMYRSSITKTKRPGVTVKLNWQNDMHKLVFGVWYERANHRQTQPLTQVDANGNPLDIWGENNFAINGNGDVYQGRNWETITKVIQPFITDTISLANDKLKLTLGVRMPHVERDGTNYPSAATGQTTYFTSSRTYDETLPSIGATYQIDPTSSVFANATKNFRAPANFTLFEPGNAFNLEPETATNFDLGYRYQNNLLTASATLFYTDFKNRQATAVGADGLQRNFNVGNVRARGFELEAGSKPINGFGVYGSLAYTDAVMTTDFVTFRSGTQVIVPTNGKTFVNTPKWLAGIGINYVQGGFFADFKTKYTGMRYSSLLNDQQIPGFATSDLSLGYRFKDAGYLKKPTLRFNVANLFDKRYLNSIEGSTINAQPFGILSASSPTYMPGAPRFASVTLSADFR